MLRKCHVLVLFFSVLSRAETKNEVFGIELPGWFDEKYVLYFAVGCFALCLCGVCATIHLLPLYFEWREALRLNQEALGAERKEREAFDRKLASSTPEPPAVVKSGKPPVFKSRSRVEFIDLESPVKRVVQNEKVNGWSEPLKDHGKRMHHHSARSNSSTGSNVSLQQLARESADYYTQSPTRYLGSSSVELQRWGGREAHHDELSE